MRNPVRDAAGPTGGDVLDVRGLQVSFETADGTLLAVDGIDLAVRAGETVGIVGESGCGKSTLARALLALLPAEATVRQGEVRLEGVDLLTQPEAERRRLRGSRVAMVFQEPMTALNPVMTVGAQVVEGVRAHQSIRTRSARARALELLALVGIPDPARRLGQYPHELSGGMRQRVMIAMAISNNPAVLVADEPTTALDVTIQAQVLELIAMLKDELGMAVVLVSHDLGVMADWADRLLVVYAGRVVEHGRLGDVLAQPRHPYTRGLLASLPPLEGPRPHRLQSIPGSAVARTPELTGCAFRARCPLATERCATDPLLVETSPGHAVACWYADGVPA